MYEDQTFREINKRMLDAVSSTIDKREGSLIYDATAPVAIELELLYATLDWFLKNTFGDTAERMFLIERALERGLIPQAATQARVKGKFTPDNINIQLGSRFSFDEKIFTVYEKAADGLYLLLCSQYGTIGNKTSGALVPLDYNAGLQKAEIIELTVPAIDDEDTEVFRARYLASFDNQAYGGNIADYKEKVMAIAGVGGVKVYPVWNGGGTVKIVFCTSEYKVPTPEHVDEVQEKLDPVPCQQQGIGIAPIGHRVTVEGVVSRRIDIATNLTLRTGVLIKDIQDSAKLKIQQYLEGLNSTWKTTQEGAANSGLIVRVSKIDTLILDIDGVIDIENTRINGEIKNLTLETDEITVLGGIIYDQ